MYEYIFLVSKKFCFSPKSIYPLIVFGISYIMNHEIEIINFEKHHSTLSLNIYFSW